MSLRFIKELEAGNFNEVEKILVDTPHVLSASKSLMAYGRARKMLSDPETYPGVTEYLTTLGLNPAFAGEFVENDQFISFCSSALNLSEANAVYSVPPIFKVMEAMVSCSPQLKKVVSQLLPALGSFVAQASKDYIKAGYAFLIAQILKHGVQFSTEVLQELADMIRQELRTCADYSTQILLVEILLRIRNRIPDVSAIAFSPAIQIHFNSLTKMNFLRTINTLICAMNDEFGTIGSGDVFKVRYLLYSGGTISYDNTNLSISLGEGIIFCGRMSLCTMLPNIGLIRLPYDILSKMQLSYRKCLLIIGISMSSLSINSPFHVKLREAQQSNLDQNVTLRFSIPNQDDVYAFRDEVGCLISSTRLLAASTASASSCTAAEQSVDEVAGGLSFCSVEAMSQMSQSALLDEDNVQRGARQTDRRSSIFLLFVDRSPKNPKVTCLTPRTPRMELPERFHHSKTPQIHANSLDSEDLTQKKTITNLNDISISSIDPDVKTLKNDHVYPLERDNHSFTINTGTTHSKLHVHDILPPELATALPPSLCTQDKTATPRKDLTAIKARHATELVEFKKKHASKFTVLRQQLLQDKDAILTIANEFTAEMQLGIEIFTDTEQDIKAAMSMYHDESSALLERHKRELLLASAIGPCSNGHQSSREAKRAQLQFLRQQRLSKVPHD